LAESHGIEVIKYSRGLSYVRNMLVEPRTKPPKVFWLHGPTGVGKTKLSVSIGLDRYEGRTWQSSGDLKWFTDYDGESVAIFDDFRSKHCDFAFLLRVLDRYPFKVPLKNGFAEWNPDVIFITCPYSPQALFAVRQEHLPEDVNQLIRRIETLGAVIEIKNLGFSYLSARATILRLLDAVEEPERQAELPPVQPLSVYHNIGMIEEEISLDLDSVSDQDIESWVRSTQ